jgi:acetyl-CoA C-acetyltransferase
MNALQLQHAMNSDQVVIASAVRTPMGALMGELSSLPAWELGGVALAGALSRAGLSGEALDGIGEVLMGNCLMAGQGQAPARQAARKAGLPDSVGAVTISKMCGSGMRAISFACDMLASGSARMVLAGGMESMSQAPHLVFARQGVKYGSFTAIDHMAHDGLEDAYERGKSMGFFAEQCVRHYGFSREELDAYAMESARRSLKAQAQGAFDEEIVPVQAQALCRRDEQPGKVRLDRIPALKPAFLPDGLLTAATSSSISDGAAALLLTCLSVAQAEGLPVLARVVSHAVHAQAPAWFTTAPVVAVQKVLDKAGWTVDEVDVWEINEAFAVVPMVAMKECGIPHEKVNVHGGACALGHPIGASGARVVVTLLGALRTLGLRRGVASLCVGGGEATAMAVEVLP